VTQPRLSDVIRRVINSEPWSDVSNGVWNVVVVAVVVVVEATQTSVKHENQQKVDDAADCNEPA